jgi:hypothetical protein
LLLVWGAITDDTLNPGVSVWTVLSDETSASICSSSSRFRFWVPFFSTFCNHPHPNQRVLSSQLESPPNGYETETLVSKDFHCTSTSPFATLHLQLFHPYLTLKISHTPGPHSKLNSLKSSLKLLLTQPTKQPSLPSQFAPMTSS